MKFINRHHKYIMAIGAACLMQATVSCYSQVTTSEVWFALRGTNGIGTGTLQDPYNGSGGYFHSWLAAWTWNQQAPDGTTQVRSNLTIHLLPSGLSDCYKTGGGNVNTPIPQGSNIKGAGLDNTIIRLANINTGGGAAVLTCGSSYDNVNNRNLNLSDVTLDCNWGGSNVTAAVISGINAFADNTVIERVKVINYGAGASIEAFPLMWTSSGNGGTCTIQDCIVQGSVKGGGYATCISAFGSYNPSNGLSTAKLFNNKVLNVPNGIAYAVGQLNATMEGNVAIGCNMGFNMDSWINEDCFIRNNVFKDTGLGIRIGVDARGSQTFNRYIVENNYIEINNTKTNDSVYKPAGMWFAGNTTNFIIRANIIVPTKPNIGIVQSNWYGLYFTGGYSQGLGTGENIKYVIENNLIDVAFQNQLPQIFFPVFNTSGNYMFNNHDFKGRSLKGFPVDGTRGDQVTGATLSGTTYTLSDDKGELEGQVGLMSSGSSTKTVTFPEPSWHTGRRLKLGFYNGGPCSLIINTVNTTYQQVFDAASQSFGFAFTYPITTSGYIALEVYSNGSQWVVRK